MDIELRALLGSARAAGIDRVALQSMLEAQMTEAEKRAFENEVRAGRVLSASNHKLIKSAQSNINKVLKAHRKSVNADPNKQTDDQQSTSASGGDDGTQNASSKGNNTGYQDGTGTRSVSPEELEHDLLMMDLKAAKHARRWAKRSKVSE